LEFKSIRVGDFVYSADLKKRMSKPKVTVFALKMTPEQIELCAKNVSRKAQSEYWLALQPFPIKGRIKVNLIPAAFAKDLLAVGAKHGVTGPGTTLDDIPA
jgi:hypothetical protein